MAAPDAPLGREYLTEEQLRGELDISAAQTGSEAAVIAPTYAPTITGISEEQLPAAQTGIYINQPTPVVQLEPIPGAPPAEAAGSGQTPQSLTAQEITRLAAHWQTELRQSVRRSGCSALEH